ncbi:MAG TPA: hypothetical protein VLK33_22940 [Terriglobales bacterium]|nr:hypothetical protein [Terriglobales bacterium]
MDILSEGWDLMIAHPPCRYLSYAANHVWNQPGREQKRREAMEFFLELYNAPISRVCVENPLGLPNSVFRKPNQIIHPYYFGESHLKRTCLWLRGLQNLWYWFDDDLFGQRTATAYPEPIYVTERENGVKLRHFSEAAHGEEKRSRTFPSVAEAMAQQWG